MFSKLKDKLKGALSVFSSKTEEEAEVKEEVVEVSQEDVKEKSKKEATKKEKKKKEKKEEKKKKEEKSREKTKEKKEVKKKAPKKKEERVEEEIKELQEKVIVEERKKGFFSKLFSKKEEVPPEEAGKVIAEAKKKKEKVLQEPEPEKEAEEEEAQRSEALSASKAKLSAEPEEEKKSFFGRIKQTITTKTISEEKFNELFWDLELILLENNVSVEVIEKIKEDLKEELVDKPLPRNVPAKIQETLQNTLKNILSFEKIDIVKKVKDKKPDKKLDKKPFIIAFFGINGAGKTTSIAKLTHYLKENNLSVVLAACDTFRAAAIQQLGEHADKLGVKMIKHDYGSDAAAVAFDAIKHAEKENVDVVLIDTAGRLHSNTNLMAELEKIIRVTKPDLKIFVGESITGNDCIEQARTFNELVEMDGVILTKADVDEKGGAPLSISYTIKKPILFLGVGQGYDDLEEFDAGVILERLGF